MQQVCPEPNRYPVHSKHKLNDNDPIIATCPAAVTGIIANSLGADTTVDTGKSLTLIDVCVTQTTGVTLHAVTLVGSWRVAACGTVPTPACLLALIDIL